MDITRINNQRVVTVKTNGDENKIPGAVVRTQAEKLLAAMPLPPGYQVSFTGENQDQQESEAFLGKVFAVAMLLIFLVIVTQFDSVSQPFLIMSSVALVHGRDLLRPDALEDALRHHHDRHRRD